MGHGLQQVEEQVCCRRLTPLLHHLRKMWWSTPHKLKHLVMSTLASRTSSSYQSQSSSSQQVTCQLNGQYHTYRKKPLALRSSLNYELCTKLWQFLANGLYFLPFHKPSVSRIALRGWN